MKRLLLTGVAFGVLIAGPAVAADLSIKAPPYVALGWSWTGCYLGVHAGGGVMHPFETDQNGSGAVAGGQLGCNYQVGQLVFGIEGEGWWSGLRSTDNFSDVARAFQAQARNRSDYDVALRAGFALDRALAYIKAGIAWGQYDFSFNCNTCNGTGVTELGSATLSGFLIGVGLEYAIAANWTAKIEYNYIGYTGRDVSFVTTGELPFTRTESDTKHIVKVGANYKFGYAAAPAVYK